MADMRDIVRTADVAKTAIRAAGSGTIGGTARVLAERAANPYINRDAQAATNRFSRGKSPPPPEKRLTGPGFYMIVIVAGIKDALDVFVNLTVLLAVLVIAISLCFAFIITFYLIYSGVDMEIRKVTTLVISTVIDMIPFISIIPVSVLSLFIIRWIEHSDHAKKLLQHKALIGAT